ncbi:MAG: hypothetical protein VB138_13485 [Burkholderia sp.]
MRIAAGDALFLGNGMGHIEPTVYVIDGVEMEEREAAPELPEDFALGYQLPLEDEGTVYRYTFELERRLELEHSLEIDDFRYSLSFVKRLEAPERHFRFPFREIPAVDADVLVNNRIFVSRTAFYSLYYALPARTRIEFDHREALTSRRQASYRARLERLIAFVEARILPVGEMLAAAAAQWRQLAPPPSASAPSTPCISPTSRRAAAHRRGASCALSRRCSPTSKPCPMTARTRTRSCSSRWTI